MKQIATVLLLMSFTASYAQVHKDKHAPVEARVNDLVSRMTLEEKIDYIGVFRGFYVRGIHRLGLPEIKLTYGPVGTHKDGRSTAYPASVLSAATWDTALVYELGKQLGRDSKARGVHILLAPGVNILRAPMGGRNFEYFTEDPFLNARMAVAYADWQDEQPELVISWKEKKRISAIDIFFDTDYDHPMESVLMGHPEQVMPFCVRNYSIRDDQGNIIHQQKENYQTVNSIRLEQPVTTCSLTIEVEHPSTDVPAAIFSVRCY